jgi:ribose 1,5-bisphosphokinase PhnN
MVGDRSVRLIGREREMRRIGEAIAPGRLVWVNGPRGIGKTAIVRSVAAQPSAEGTWLYVADARTRASIARELAAAYEAAVASSVRRMRSPPRARAQRATAVRWPPADLKAIVLDHVDEPGPRLNDLVDAWREHCAVVVVARSRETLRGLHRQLYDCEIVEVAHLPDHDARLLVATWAQRLRLSPMPDRELTALVRGSAGSPGLIVRALREARRRGAASAERLLFEARIQQIASEPDAIVRARLRAARGGRASSRAG